MIVIANSCKIRRIFPGRVLHLVDINKSTDKHVAMFSCDYYSFCWFIIRFYMLTLRHNNGALFCHGNTAIIKYLFFHLHIAFLNKLFSYIYSYIYCGQCTTPNYIYCNDFVLCQCHFVKLQMSCFITKPTF